MATNRNRLRTPFYRHPIRQTCHPIICLKSMTGIFDPSSKSNKNSDFVFHDRLNDNNTIKDERRPRTRVVLTANVVHLYGQ